MKDLAPIALFVYNRPRHTLQTLEALAKNDLAKYSTLYVFSDGPQSDAPDHDTMLISRVREVVDSQNWCAETIHIKRDTNLGLAENIVSGVTQVLQRHGRVIVLEDDIITGTGFLTFMNDALSVYAQDEQVMHISGYMFPVNGTLPETFFYKQTSCWGWATWERAWRHYDPNPVALRNKLEQTGKLKEADIDGTGQFLRQLDRNISGSLNTWAVKWQFSVQLANGLCLHPGRSLVRNIGLDGSGKNSASSLRFDVQPANHITVNKIPISDYKPVYPLLRKFYHTKPSWKRVTRRALLRVPAPVRSIVRRLTDSKYRAEVYEEKRLRSLPRFTPTKSTFLGRTIALADAASFLYARDEIFRQEIYRFISHRERPVVIDCGANIGMSVIYFKQQYPGAEIIAFEPDKAIFDILIQNIKTYQLTSVTAINKGLWNTDTTLRFFSEGADAGRIATEEDTEKIIEIETTTLRPYLNRQIDFLKIDIEGAELRVLNDCKDLLKNVDRLFVEYHSFLNEEQKLDELLSLLKEAGFRYAIQQHGVVSRRPFVRIEQQSGMDILLNISAFRT